MIITTTFRNGSYYAVLRTPQDQGFKALVRTQATSGEEEACRRAVVKHFGSNFKFSLKRLTNKQTEGLPQGKNQHHDVVAFRVCI